MCAKSMSEPIEDRGELNEAEKSRGELFVASADTPVAFDAAKEIFHLVATAIVAAMESHRPAARAFRRDANARALSAQPRAESIGIEALVGDGAMTTHAGQQRFDGDQVMSLPGRDPECDGTTAPLHNGGQLGVDAAFGAPDGLGRLSAPRIGPILMQFDMRAIEVPQLARGACGDHGQHPCEQPGGTPAAKTRVDRTPRTKSLRQVAPGQTGAQHKEHRRDHAAVILRRPAPQLPPARFSTRPVNFFSPRHTGSGSSHREIAFMRALGSTSARLVPSDFAHTP